MGWFCVSVSLNKPIVHSNMPLLIALQPEHTVLHCSTACRQQCTAVSNVLQCIAICTRPATRTNVQLDGEDQSVAVPVSDQTHEEGSEDVKTKSKKSSGKCSLSCCLGLCNFDCAIKCTWDWEVIIPNLIFFTCLIAFWVALGFQLAHIKSKHEWRTCGIVARTVLYSILSSEKYCRG